MKDFPPSKEPVGRLVAGEVLAYLGQSLLFPFGLGRTRRRMPRRAEQRTIVLVHGYLANRASLFPLGLYLQAHGLGPVLSFSYASRRGIDGAAADLREFLRKHVGGGRIDLVGRSMGGVVARVYLQDLGGARRVDRCVTLGTPHRGTYGAYYVASRVGLDLRPDSPLMQRLEATRGEAADVRFSSIVAGADVMVVPRVSAANGDDVVHFPDLGHLTMLFSPRVFRAVADRLEGPVP